MKYSGLAVVLVRSFICKNNQLMLSSFCSMLLQSFSILTPLTTFLFVCFLEEHGGQSCCDTKFFSTLFQIIVGWLLEFIKNNSTTRTRTKYGII